MKKYNLLNLKNELESQEGGGPKFFTNDYKETYIKINFDIDDHLYKKLDNYSTNIIDGLKCNTIGYKDYNYEPHMSLLNFHINGTHALNKASGDPSVNIENPDNNFYYKVGNELENERVLTSKFKSFMIHNLKHKFNEIFGLTEFKINGSDIYGQLANQFIGHKIEYTELTGDENKIKKFRYYFYNLLLEYINSIGLSIKNFYSKEETGDSGETFLTLYLNKTDDKPLFAISPYYKDHELWNPHVSFCVINNDSKVRDNVSNLLSQIKNEEYTFEFKPEHYCVSLE